MSFDKFWKPYADETDGDGPYETSEEALEEQIARKAYDAGFAAGVEHYRDAEAARC